MSTQDCKGAFAAVFATNKGKELASAIDACSPKCACQHNTVSEYSIGPIGDDEYLIRLVISPQHVRIKKTATTPKDGVLSQAESSGMSIFRDSASNEELKAVAEKLVNGARSNGNAKAGLFGVLRFRCGDARDYFPDDEEDPVYCIYDTAKADLPSHGDTFQRVNGFDQPRRDLRRKGLFSVLEKTFVPVDKFRDGLLASLAPPSGQ
ncbi:hypothetical protein [Pleomorphomonas carboxyditropha]|uniref:hypothetical protein n=1 Tax=Pleomorphomonas carboxyditropha TaxID=2023338 RepID=UPI001054FDD6|nr:hypothetical protein [Pleomorphomonas carboxyditropha]